MRYCPWVVLFVVDHETMGMSRMIWVSEWVVAAEGSSTGPKIQHCLKWKSRGELSEHASPSNLDSWTSFVLLVLLWNYSLYIENSGEKAKWSSSFCSRSHFRHVTLLLVRGCLRQAVNEFPWPGGPCLQAKRATIFQRLCMDLIRFHPSLQSHTNEEMNRVRVPADPVRRGHFLRC